MEAVYDSIGRTYSASRRADPRIVGQVASLLRLPPGARLADVGAGTGNYSNALANAGFQVSAVEPSAEMRAQAEVRTGVVWFEGAADESLDGVVATLAIHHFTSVPDAAREIHRICPNGPIVIFTIDPRKGDSLWFYDYFPEIQQRDLESFPPVEELAAFLAANKGWETTITSFHLPHDLIDHVMIAGWNRPEIYLDETFRANTSGFALADPAVVAEGIARLQNDLESGAWDEKHGHLRRQDAFDAGFRFIACRARPD
jgi:ubiquinone/menaquinone biosynthesis C-methylase UbiE